MTKILIGLVYACLLATGGVMFWMNAQGGRLHQLLARNANAAEPRSRASEASAQPARSTAPAEQPLATPDDVTHMTAKPVMLDSSQVVLETMQRSGRSARLSAAARGATLP